MSKVLAALTAAAVLAATLGMSPAPAEAGRVRDKVEAAAKRANISKSSVKCLAKLLLKKGNAYGGC